MAVAVAAAAALITYSWVAWSFYWAPIDCPGTIASIHSGEKQDRYTVTGMLFNLSIADYCRLRQD